MGPAGSWAGQVRSTGNRGLGAIVGPDSRGLQLGMRPDSLAMQQPFRLGHRKILLGVRWDIQSSG